MVVCGIDAVCGSIWYPRCYMHLWCRYFSSNFVSKLKLADLDKTCLASLWHSFVIHELYPFASTCPQILKKKEQKGDFPTENVHGSVKIVFLWEAFWQFWSVFNEAAMDQKKLSFWTINFSPTYSRFYNKTVIANQIKFHRNIQGYNIGM